MQRSMATGLPTIYKETLRRIHHKFKDGVLAFEHHIKGKNTVMPKTAECIAWLQFFVISVGDTNLTKDVYTCHHALEVTSTKRC